MASIPAPPRHSYQLVTDDMPPSNKSALPAHMDLDHWPSVPYPLNKVCKAILKTCCLLIYGHRDLEDAWNSCIEDDGGPGWARFEDRYANRMSQLNVIGGLVFTGLAAWVTTVSPLPNLLDYNQRGPYLCLFVAFGGTWGSIIVSSATLYGTSLCSTSSCGAKWYRETLMASRSRVVCTLILLAYPFYSMGISSAFGIIGVLLASWRSPDRLMNIAGTMLLAIPITMLFAWLWTQTILIKSPESKAERLSNT